MSNMLFCMYIILIMHICILLYIHVTVLYYILASFQKIDVNVNVLLKFKISKQRQGQF